MKRIKIGFLVIIILITSVVAYKFFITPKSEIDIEEIDDRDVEHIQEGLS